MLHIVKDLEKLKIDSLNGELGYVHDFYIDDQEWITRYIVVDTGNWLTGRKVLISPHAVNKPNFDEKSISVDLTTKQIEESPSILIDEPVSRQREKLLSKYYGWPIYWTVDPVAQSIRAQQAIEEQKKMQANKSVDPHLRSIREIRDYSVKAIDGEVGKVDAFLINETDWTIKYLVIDTRKWFTWLPGGSYHLISPRWIKDIDWSESRIDIEYDKETLENSPLYDSNKELDDEFENRLYDCYSAFIEKKYEPFV
jgi:hypothetical protein